MTKYTTETKVAGTQSSSSCCMAPVQLMLDLSGLSYTTQMEQVRPPLPTCFSGECSESVQLDNEGSETQPVQPTVLPPIVADPSWSLEQKFEHYEHLIAIGGGRLDPSLPVSVLGIRGYGTHEGADGAEVTDLHETVNNRDNDDTLVVIVLNTQGAPEIIQEVPGATHPTQARLACDSEARHYCTDTADDQANLDFDVSGAEPDSTPDGHPDVARIRPGSYVARPLANNWEDQGAGDLRENSDGSLRHSHQLYNAEGTNEIPADRDADHDRHVSEEEATASRNRGQSTTPGLEGKQVDEEVGDYAVAVHFHAGSASIGCQTIRDKQDYLRFMELIGRDDQGVIRSFNYLLIDANELVQNPAFLNP